MKDDVISLKRDCDATLIPVGTRLSLVAGTPVTITQALGGSYTVNVNGNLARIDGKDADALGIKPDAKETPEMVGGSETDEALLWEQMRTCYDPEIPVNVVDMGLIYDCKLSPLKDGGSRAEVTMTLTSPGCGMGDVIAEDVRQKLLRVPNVKEAHVEIVFDPPWDPGRMSDAARLEVGFF